MNSCIGELYSCAYVDMDVGMGCLSTFLVWFLMTTLCEKHGVFSHTTRALAFQLIPDLSIGHAFFPGARG